MFGSWRSSSSSRRMASLKSSRVESLDVPVGAHQAFPGAEFGRVLGLRSLDLRRHDARRDRAGDLVGHLVLDGEDVLEAAIVALGPDVMPIGCVDELRGDANAVPGFAHAAFEHVAHAKFAADLAHVDRLALVGERRVARDDEQPARSRQRRDDILGDAVGEILLLRIAAHVLEGQHRDRRLGRKRRAWCCDSVLPADPEPDRPSPAARCSSVRARHHLRTPRRACRAPAGRRHRRCRCRPARRCLRAARRC